MTIPWWPVVFVDIAGSMAVLFITAASIAVARGLSAEKPGDAFRHYVFMLTLAIGVFASSRSLGHLLHYALDYSGMKSVWKMLSPFTGAVNTASFIAVFAFSMYFDRLLRVKLAADKTEVELATTRSTAVAARQNEMRLHAILDGMEDAIYVIDDQFRIKFFNRKMKTLLPDIEVGAYCFRALKNLDARCDACRHTDILENDKPVSREFFISSLSRSFNVLEMPMEWVDGGKVRLNVARDITDQKKLEDQLRQAQKMESIGRLAGGVAHDFNNVLSGIMGYGELALMRLADDHPARRDIQMVIEAGEKAAVLTQQLLAFSRKQVLEMKVIDINAVVDRMSKMLSRMIGEDISLEVAIGSAESRIRADAGQVEQVVMNLAVNARDAMPSGGRLRIETADAEIDEFYADRQEGIKPGRYVVLTISDSGEGMTKDVREKIFEPFFTTKEIGKGTGLGLATVYGIIKQHHGHIHVYSEPGHGTTFKIYFPAELEASINASSPREAAVLRMGTETVLVVDDSQPIRRLIVETLAPLGYNVIDASSGAEALRVATGLKDRIDLLITDMIMPGMNGKQLSEQIGSSHPETRTIFMSGYADASIIPENAVETGNFIQKPVMPSTLLAKISHVLEKG
ncbi:MAG: response regulator [Nitrospirae bacterium]|nr:response regulator [Nitrospirota bacterium]